MRTGTWGAGLLVIALQAAVGAQDSVVIDPPAESLGAPPQAVYRPYAEEAVPSSTKRLIQQRAFYRAQMRQARIESRKWLGISTSRPTVSGDYFCTEVNPPFYYGYYGHRMWNRDPWAR